MHADRVTYAILTAGSDPETAARRFMERPTRRSVARAVVFHPDYDGAAATPVAMTAEELLFHGLGYACGTVQPQGMPEWQPSLLEGLQGLLSQGSEDRRVPVPWLLADRDGAMNEIGSWFGMRPGWVFPAPIGLVADDARSTVSSILNETKVAQAAQARLWFAASLMTRPHLDEERSTLAAQAVQSVDFDALVGSDPEFGSSALRWVAEVARSSGDPTARASFREGLVRHAGRLAAERGGYLQGADDDSVVSDLLEAAAAVSRAVDEEEGWHQFGDLIVRFAEVWPSAASLLRHTVASLATVAHPARGKSLWDAWSRLRAME